MESRLRPIRQFEIESHRQWFKPGAKVLELGGGYGYQASIISGWGCEVVSLDVEPKGGYFPVQSYDGVSIPFKDESFDIVFSSNTLEHVNLLRPLIAETRRVMSRDAVGIHTLPSPIWRFWTDIVHYVNLAKKLSNREYSLSYVVNRELIPGRHGTKGNAVSEMYYFSRYYWKKLFEEEKLKVIGIQPNKLFYTSPGLIPNASLKVGALASRILGSSANTFIVNRVQD